MKTTLSQIQDLQGEKVLVRAGFDVPMKNGEVQDVSRIESIVPTVQYITSRGGVVILLAHQGRPEGKDLEYSQRPLQPILEDLLGQTVQFCSDCIGSEVESAIDQATPGSVLLLENVRFYTEEKSKDELTRQAFAAQLAKGATAYVNEAFTNCHRAHASMVELAQILPSYVGLALEQEILHLEGVFDTARKPICLIVAGAKIDTKVPVISHFLTRGDFVLVGGLVAHSFLEAQGLQTGAVSPESESVEIAKNLLEQSTHSKATIVLPVDLVTAATIESTTTNVQTIPFKEQLGFDIGPQTIELYKKYIQESHTIIWNGPVGVSQKEQFAQGSIALAQQIIESTSKGAVSILGGGDTIDTWNRYDLPMDKCTFVSMGGGAMLTFISNGSMPALQALER